MRHSFIFLIVCVVVLVGCSSIDCPLNNTVHTQYKLQGYITTLADTLTISTTKTTGVDSVLINRDVEVDSFFLPMSYTQAEDIFYFELRDTLGNVTVDQVTVTKEDHPHFESVDCSPNYFHTITGVTWTNNRIDSIVIHNPEVTYDATEPHFYIYFRPAD